MTVASIREALDHAHHTMVDPEKSEMVFRLAKLVADRHGKRGKGASIERYITIYQAAMLGIIELLAEQEEDIAAWNTRVELDGWQLIESAPKDGTWYLTYGLSQGLGMACYPLAWAEEWGDPMEGVTHWRPLPAPPK